MILQRLVEHYDRLAADPMSVADLPIVGFSRERISFCIIISLNLTIELQDLREPQKRGELRPKPFLLPHYGEKRTANDRPYYLWDSTEYTLGSISSLGNAKRSLRRYDRFKDLHVSLQSSVSHPEFDILCEFLKQWNPESAIGLARWTEACGTNTVFRIAGQRHYLHDLPECQNAWKKLLAGRDAVTGQSLLSGTIGSIARLHPAIKGIHDPGGQAEKGIVAFNKEKTAFESYGKEQSRNQTTWSVFVSRLSSSPPPKRAGQPAIRLADRP